jgi:hypothetical protein
MKAEHLWRLHIDAKVKPKVVLYDTVGVSGSPSKGMHRQGKM